MGNAFDWQGRPSIFTSSNAADVKVFKPTRRGISYAQSASLAVKRRERASGRSPGTIVGLSPSADRQLLTPADRKGRARR